MAYRLVNKIQQFNFQINRVLTYGEMAGHETEIIQATKGIKTLDDWFDAWVCLGKKAECEGRWLHAAYSYRMAEFFLTGGRADKQEMYDKSIELFYRGFDHLGISYEVRDIPYKGTKMHTVYLPAQKEKRILLVCGGYDSFIEEFVIGVLDFLDAGYSLVFYEGDGQGKTLQEGLPFIHNWEEPTQCILDAYEITSCALIGISWGGYLALRAAVFDKRITAVAAYDVLENGMDIMLNVFPSLLKRLVGGAIHQGRQRLVNKLVGFAMKKSLLAQWAFTQGMHITHTKTPFEFYCKLQLHTLEPIAEKITQDVLLLAGEKDHYIPKEQFEKARAELINARSLKARMFTVEEGGEQHCQIGNHKLAIDEIVGWLEQIEDR